MLSSMAYLGFFMRAIFDIIRNKYIDKKKTLIQTQQKSNSFIMHVQINERCLG